jgi:hypothetical protein
MLSPGSLKKVPKHRAKSKNCRHEIKIEVESMSKSEVRGAMP